MMTTLTFFATIGCMSMLATDNVPWPEHPRPDFARTPWVNLNGPWSFAFDPQDAGEKDQWFTPGRHAFERQIVVPFPWESRLSGIGDTEYKGVAWYSRDITLPSGSPWDGRDVWLVVGACDFEAKVWVNGQPAAEHVGGYTPFDVNLAPFAKPGEKVTVTIRALDTTNDQQPTGKQVHWYTRTSGIWQTVYIEPRGKGFIQALRGRPDIRAGKMVYEITTSQRPAGRLILRSPNKQFNTVEVVIPQGEAPIVSEVTVKEPKLWSPDSPSLYDIHIELADDQGHITDRVESYFGLREVSVGKAPGRDYQYIFLNGKPIYLIGALHQSFHPDSIYQYPDDAVLRSDYELCKRIGLNFLRIHIKTPVPRELYWADRRGVLIMQDIPNYWTHSPQAQQWWQQHAEAAIARDYNHPAVFSWCLFNETWGIGSGGYSPERHQWVADMYHHAKKLDPTRLIEDNSPCNYDHVITDINSWHFYINNYDAARRHIQEVVDKTFPGSTFNYIKGHKQTDAPLINSEYGGIGAGSGDMDISWCFKYLTNELRKHDKICGYVYTELSDIEWEHNGFVNYDRSPKEYGYDSWHPGFSLKDLNNPDFVVLDAPPVVELKPGETRTVPVFISHFSQRDARDLKVCWRIDWQDPLIPEEIEGAPRSWFCGPATWEAYRVVAHKPIEVRADGTGTVGTLLVELRDGDEVITRNYVNLLVKRGPSPRFEVSEHGLATLRFEPADFAEWTFAGEIPFLANAESQKISGYGAGAVEYHLELPKGLQLDGVSGLLLMAELSSAADGERLDWPARYRDQARRHHPQTDTRKWPTDLTVLVNGVPVATQTLPDDPADARGVLSHHRRLHPGTYGQLATLMVEGDRLAQILKAAESDRIIRLRFEVPESAAHRGGLAIFGETMGRYTVEPACLIALRHPHGLTPGDSSDKLVATHRIRDRWHVLLPCAEDAPKDWYYATDKPQDTWTHPDFDAVTWKVGAGGFGGPHAPDAIVKTPWLTPEIWLRTEVFLENAADIRSAYWRLYHDEDVVIYLNGQKVLEQKGYTRNYINVPFGPEAKNALRAGRNVVAVHCRQTAGAQNIDVGIRLLLNEGR